jgi:1-deoxy-D-xylulose-5-phosphate reductoisomerase
VAERRDVIILGSTGSIGRQALDVIERNPERFRVTGLSAGGGQPDLLEEQARRHGVTEIAVGEVESADLAGRPCDVVLNGLAGAAGLLPTLRALEAGSALALANKESLIIGGPLVRERARPGQIRPVDSEHSALAQCLMSGSHAEVSRLILTASGGPFRGWSREQLAAVTPAQALAHPTWSMGPLVTVNSSTLVNKGLEVIEAHLLFDIPFERIDVVIHPQSVVHSMVEFVDGSTMAQASPPDMRLPIAWALGWPERIADAAPGCDWSQAVTWEFLPVDHEAFPAVGVARRAGAAGGTAPAVFNAADEVCVAAFLEGALPYPGIVEVVSAVLDEHLGRASGTGREDDGNPGRVEGVLTLDDVLGADAWARGRAEDRIASR